MVSKNPKPTNWEEVSKNDRVNRRTSRIRMIQSRVVAFAVLEEQVGVTVTWGWVVEVVV
jgi:hypothetical protein